MTECLRPREHLDRAALLEMVAVLIECTECLTISLLTSNLLSRAQVSVLPKAPSVLFLNRQLFPKLIQHCMSTTLHEKKIFLRIKTFIQIQTIISLEACMKPTILNLKFSPFCTALGLQLGLLPNILPSALCLLTVQPQRARHLRR